MCLCLPFRAINIQISLVTCLQKVKADISANSGFPKFVKLRKWGILTI